ncbi:MAG: energy-coupling factor transporter transmembrane protein EcfT [Lachnospiraceae bacterium]|nr:energy-coupling factor transporter transmembrane protein EcfT [Lachnospiraceae bacterium]
MIRDITIGQYYPSESVIHRLDARVKFIGTIAYIISLFLFDTFWGFLPAFVWLTVIIVLSGVPVRYIAKGLKAMLFLMIFLILFNIFLTPGEVLAEWWIFKITDNGLINAAFMVLRLMLLVVGSGMMTYTTTPSQLTAGMESLFKPLGIFKVPVHEVAMMMSIALRFIPILLEEADKIMKAQQARGADFESGNILKRAKALIPVLVPLFVSAFRRAGELAEAMEARCYHGGKGRTKLHPLKFAKRDYVSLILLIGFVVGMGFMP